MDIPINNQAEQNCFICEKHKGNINICICTLFRVIQIHQKSFGHRLKANWTGAPHGDSEKIKKLCERIRKYMVNEYAYNK